MDSDPARPDQDAETTDPGGQKDNEAGIDRRFLAAVGYLPMLFFVPLLVGRGDGYARYHGQQSLALFVAFAALWVGIWFIGLILGRILGDIIFLGFIFKALSWFLSNVVGGLLSLGYLALMIIGIAQAIAGRRLRMPLVGRYAECFQES